MNRRIKIRVPNIFFISVNCKRSVNINNCLFALIMFVCIIFPHDRYHLKLLFLACLLVYNMEFFTLYKSAKKTDKIAFYMVFAFIPFLAVTSFLNTSVLGKAVMGAYPAVFFLLLYPVRKADTDCEAVISWLLKAVVLMIVGSIFLDAAGILDTGQNPVLAFLHEGQEILGDYGKRADFSFVYRVSYRTYVLYLILACYALNKKQYGWWFLSLLAVLFTDSGALLASFVFCSALLMAERSAGKNLAGISVILAVVIIILATAVLPFCFNSWDMLVRQDIWKASVQAFLSDPGKLLFGFGMGQTIFIPARQSYEEIIEISYVQFIREHGLIALLIFIGTISYPIKKLYKTKDRWIVYAALGFFIVSATNNFLFNSTGFVLYILLFSVYKTREETDGS